MVSLPSIVSLLQGKESRCMGSLKWSTIVEGPRKHLTWGVSLGAAPIARIAQPQHCHVVDLARILPFMGVRTKPPAHQPLQQIRARTASKAQLPRSLFLELH